MNLHISNHVGVAGAKIHWMRTKDGKTKYWCRQAIAIMGSFNMPHDYIMNTSPFEPRFRDNYVEGKGNTKEEALEAMNKEKKNLSESLWAT